MLRKTDDRRIRSIKKAAACALAFAFLLTACGMAKSNSAMEAPQSAYDDYDRNSYAAGNGAYASYDDSYEYESAAEESEDMETALYEDAGVAEEKTAVSDTSGDGDNAADPADLQSSNRKIVYTGNVSLQTLEYEKSSQSIHEKITKYGGFIENEDTYNEDPYWYYSDRSGAAANRTRRKLTVTARIPSEQFDAFMEDLGNDGQVTNTSVSAKNISVSYATHDASRKALEIEQDRLLKMMDKAETIEEMIAVEERLTEVERDLGDEMTTLSAMDRDVNFSTIYISLQEVFEYSENVVEVTYGERLQRAFGRAIESFVTFWEDVLLFVTETFPFLIMLAIALYVIIRLLRRRRRRRLEEKYAAMEAVRARAAAGGPNAYNGGYPGDPAAWTEPRKKGFFRRRKKDEMPPLPPAEPAPYTPPADSEGNEKEPEKEVGKESEKGKE